jgi:hypothetical protein
MGVMMNHSDFSDKGGRYWAYFSKEFDKAVADRPKFGKNPMRASVEHDDEQKLRFQADPPFDLNDYADLRVLTLYKVTRDFTNRGGKEVCFIDICLLI